MSKSKVATLGILFVAFIWGTEFVLIHNAIVLLEPNSFNAVRFGSASLFIGICLLFWNKSVGLSWPMVRHGCFLGLLLCLGFSLQTFGLLYTSVSNCAFITSLSVLIVPLAAFLFLGERPRYLAIVGVCVAAIGLYILTTSGSTSFNLGDILTLICAAMFALHMVYTGKYSRQYEVLPLTLIQLVTVSILSFIGALLFEDWGRLLDINVIGSFNVLLAVGIAAILGTALAILIQTSAQGYISSTRVALIFSLEPVFAALTAYLVLNEQLPANAGVGAGMILAGILLAEIHFQGNKEMVSVIGE